MTQLLKTLQVKLKAAADPITQKSAQRFFKETIRLYGVKTATVSQIAKQLNPQLKTLGKAKSFELAESLWQSGYLEETFIACHIAYRYHPYFQQEDFPIFQLWVHKYINNWASCDTFCNHTLGTFVEQYPTYLQSLKDWTKSTNRWVKRASAVSLIVPAKRGKFLKDVLEICDQLLLDPDDMVQKGYGWLLKVTSQAHHQAVFDYVMKHKTIMPRTALRYAIEKMPPNLRHQAMAK